jgi:hypothetical protein
MQVLDTSQIKTFVNEFLVVCSARAGEKREDILVNTASQV